MDDIDLAQRNQADEIQRVLHNRPRQTTELGAEICAWCEEDIPMSRRKAVPGCTLCVNCQSQKERLKTR